MKTEDIKLLEEFQQWFKDKTEKRDPYASPIVDALAGITRVGELLRIVQAQVDAIKPIADYANRQADMAQIRLLKQGDLYDDTYWQPVLDKIRFELLQIAAIKGTELKRSLLYDGHNELLRLVEEQKKALERVRNLTGFHVPLSPPIRKAVWQSDIEAAIKGDKL